jgi:putative two-component system response regulator
MVVDDEARNLRLMEALLAPEGYEVILAQDGEEALVRARQEPPDVILLDIMMAGIDGLEVARQLQANEETKAIPIVMVTALTETDARVKALEAGAADFLSKPVERVELRARVKSLLKVKAYNDHIRDHARELEAEVAKRTQLLKTALAEAKAASLDTVYRLSRAAEYRDEDTGTHILRVSRYAAAIARQMDLTEKTIESIMYASPMHDVGKIGIPDRILLKPGKLDPDEWEVMKQHTLIGGRILQGSHTLFVRLGEEIAMTHHEKWDGSGYPKGLKGRDIPLSGRIAAIVDVFDALTTNRPYRKALPVDEALSIIRESVGTQFDPDVAAAFFAVKDVLLEIAAKSEQMSTDTVSLDGTKEDLPDGA